MLFLIYTTAKPGSEETIDRLRNEHRAYLAPRTKDVYLGGPLLEDDCRTPLGGILIMEFDNYGQARQFAAEQPYAMAGIIEEIKVYPFVPFIERGTPAAEMTLTQESPGRTSASQ